MVSVQAPSVRRAMHSVLYKCQQRLGSWVGSSVVHLGDHNVPNALMFIDKVGYSHNHRWTHDDFLALKGFVCGAEKVLTEMTIHLHTHVDEFPIHHRWIQWKRYLNRQVDSRANLK